MEHRYVTYTVTDIHTVIITQRHTRGGLRLSSRFSRSNTCFQKVLL